VVTETDDAIRLALGQHPDLILLLRPDHYVAAAFSAARADAAADAIRILLAATWPDPPAPTATKRPAPVMAS
jgi:hypothetical protein